MRKIALLLLVACYAMADDNLYKPLQIGPKNRNQIVRKGFEIGDTVIFDGVTIFDVIKFPSNLKTDSSGTVYGDTSGAIFTCDDVYNCIDTSAVVATQSYVNNGFWNINGNAGTDTATNFIGTTDAKNFQIKTNNIQRVSIDGGGGFFNTVDSNGSQIYTGYQVVNFGFGDVLLSSAKCVRTIGAVKYTAGVETIPLGTHYTQAVLAAIDTTDFSGFIGSAQKDSFTINFNYGGGITPAQLYFNRTSFGVRSTSDTGQNFIMQPNPISDGNVGIGTDAPTAKLHVAGGFKLVDGTQANGYVLTSDANGLASWKGLGGSNGSDIPAYANNAAAFAVLGAGKLYYTDVAGEYILKVTH